MKILSYFFILLTSTLAYAENNYLQSFQSIYHKNLMSLAQKLSAAKTKNAALTLSSLRKMESSYQQEGKLEDLLKVKAFLKGLTIDQLLSTKIANHPKIQNALNSLIEKNNRETNQYKLSNSKLKTAYKNALLKHIKKLTQQNKIEDAILLQDELKRLSQVKDPNPENLQQQIVSQDKVSNLQKHAFSDNSLTIVQNAKLADLTGLADGSIDAQMNQKILSKKWPLEVKLKKSGILFRLIPSGSCIIGKEQTNPPIKINKPFYLGKFEVTQKQWISLMGNNPSKYHQAGLSAPVDTVNWNDCQQFIQKLQKKEGLSKFTLSLPTETEWEYSCRAGTATPFYTGTKGGDPVAWFAGNSQKTSHPVGLKKANAFGLYDLYGNIWEWCENPTQKNKQNRALRGGAWMSHGVRCDSSGLYGANPKRLSNWLGFRLILRMK